VSRNQPEHGPPPRVPRHAAEDRFTWERKVRAARDVPLGIRAVLFILATYMDKDGSNCRPTLDHLAEETGIARSTLAKNIKKAEELGWLDDSPALRGGRRGDRGFASTRKPTVPESCHPDSGRHRHRPQSGDSDSGAVPESDDTTSRVQLRGLPESAQRDSTKSYQVIPPPRHTDEEDDLHKSEGPGQDTLGASFGAKLRARTGATWSDQEITSVLPTMTEACGGGARGEVQAQSILMQLALRTHNPVKSLRGFVLALSREDLASLPQWHPPRDVLPVKPIGCDACKRGWLGEDEQGRPRPCPSCKPHTTGTTVTAVAA
jgi:hypothetical protein